VHNIALNFIKGRMFLLLATEWHVWLIDKSTFTCGSYVHTYILLISNKRVQP